MKKKGKAKKGLSINWKMTEYMFVSMLCSVFTKDRSDQNGVQMPYLGWSYNSSLHKIQNRLRGLAGDDLFLTLQHLSGRQSVGRLLLLSYYFHGKSSDEPHLLV